MSGLRATMRLYGLVKNLGSTDDLHRQSVDILCTLDRAGGKAIRAFVSRLDAELMTRGRGLEEYRVVPLRTFDPNPFIQEHQGWLKLHVCCGFVVPADQSLLNDGMLSPMGWYVYSDIGQWTAKHYIDFGPQMASLLQTSYDRIGLRDYNAVLNDLDSASDADLKWQVAEAWQTLHTASSPDSHEDCHALFDPVDNRWCLVETDVDIYQPHPEPQKQGALS
ncbi:hypothetical protein LOY38_08615 [Pseudomonas sp. B21-015]|uniref:hypothetical protein n=1 Tax=Pseudomonas sp. B21-015 TaxID=2895473 RepID=UPI002160C720|nr:hypothetical protein [Pseudomonas sp. B21-015]UVM52080.1 hypothetical protein LOY38_08615 [Pseudomonas sp. B21-015]